MSRSVPSSRLRGEAWLCGERPRVAAQRQAHTEAATPIAALTCGEETTRREPIVEGESSGAGVGTTDTGREEVKLVTRIST